MANELMPGIPSLPGDETTWTAFVDQFETLKKGDNSVSLTEWDTGNTTRPEIAAGSALEIAGGACRFATQTAITDEPGLASGTVYLMVMANDPGADDATPYFTNTTPVWRDDLNGWYDTTGDGRYTGHVMEWDGASLYQNKAWYDNEKSGKLFKGIGDNTIEGNLTASALKTTNDYTYGTIAGLRLETRNVTVVGHLILWCTLQGLTVEVLGGGTWRSVGVINTGTDNPISVFSNGSNVRVVAGSNTADLAYYVL